MGVDHGCGERSARRTGIRRGFSYKAAILVITLGRSFYFFISPFIDKSVLKKRKYAITNKRIIIHANETSVYSMPLDSIEKIRFIETGDGKGHV